MHIEHLAGEDAVGRGSQACLLLHKPQRTGLAAVDIPPVHHRNAVTGNGQASLGIDMIDEKGDVRIVLRTIEYYHIAPAHLAESLQAHALQPGGHRTDVEIAVEARPHDGLAHQQAVTGLQGRQHGIGGDDEDIKQEDTCQEPQQVEEQQREHCSHQPHKGTLQDLYQVCHAHFDCLPTLTNIPENRL